MENTQKESNTESFKKILESNFVILTAKQIHENVEKSLQMSTSTYICTSQHEFISVSDLKEYLIQEHILNEEVQN